MKVEGLVPKFWVVTVASSISTLGDICFCSDFRHLIQQVRGGLHEREIVGIFADEAKAIEEARSLLVAVSEQKAASATHPEIRFHPSPWSDWFATQHSTRAVWICDKTTGEQVRVDPPKDWGMNWNWNISEDETGIVFQRTFA